MAQRNMTRRQALGGVVGALAGAGPLVAQQRPPLSAPAAPPASRPTARLVPRSDLVNALEFEDQARLVLAPAMYARIAGGSRDLFDRITLRQRLMVPALDLDLSLSLFGDTHFAPIIVAPMGQQTRFHPDGELATVRGASAARAAMVVSSQAGAAIADIASAAKVPLWYQVFAAENDAVTRAREATAAGCRVLCVTVGAMHSADGSRISATSARRDWHGVDAIRKIAGSVPVIVKGIATHEAAAEALRHDVLGVVVSNYGGLVGPDRDATILALPRVVDAVAGRVPVLVDGSYRRGTDILKALALGARAVLIGRPVLWGLAAYGQDGVQTVLELLQTELARYMAMSGRPNLASIDAALVRVHAPHQTQDGRRG